MGGRKHIGMVPLGALSSIGQASNCLVMMEPVEEGVWIPGAAMGPLLLSKEGLKSCQLAFDFNKSWRSTALVWPSNRALFPLSSLRKVVGGKPTDSTLSGDEIKTVITDFLQRKLSVTAEHAFYCEEFGDPVVVREGIPEFRNPLAITAGTEEAVVNTDGLPMAFLSAPGIQVWQHATDEEGEEGTIVIRNLFPEAVDIILDAIGRAAGDHALVRYIDRIQVIGVTIESCGLKKIPPQLSNNVAISTSLQELSLANNSLEGSDLFDGTDFQNLHELNLNGNATLDVSLQNWKCVPSLARVSYVDTVQNDSRSIEFTKRMIRRWLRTSTTGYLIDSRGRFVAVSAKAEFETHWIAKYVMSNREIFSIRLIVPTEANRIDGSVHFDDEFDYTCHGTEKAIRESCLPCVGFNSYAS